MKHNDTSLDKQAAATLNVLTDSGSNDILLNKTIIKAHQEWIATLDMLQDLIFIHDEDFLILRCNHAYQQQAGIPYNQIIGHPYFEIFPKTHTPLNNSLSAMKQDVNNEDYETLNVGDLIYHSRAYVVRDTNNNYLHSVHILEDVTEWMEIKKALQTSENKYRRLFEAAKDGILILNEQTGAIVDANPFILGLTAYTLEEILGKNLWEIGLIADIEKSKLSFEELQNNEYIRYEDLPLMTKDGRTVNIEFVSNVYLVEDRKVIQCNIRDISERIAMKEALKTSESRYRRLFEAAENGILILDAETGIIVDANPFILKLTAYTLKEIIGKSLWGLGLAKDTAASKLSFEVLQNNNFVRYEDLPIQRKDGRTVDVEFVSNVYLVNNRRVIQCNIRDISEQLIAKQVLKESEQKFHSITSTAQDAILIINDKGKITYWNEAAEKTFGYTKEEALGKALHPLLAPSRYKKDYDRGFRHFIKTGEGPVIGKTIEMSALKKDGTEFPIELSLSANLKKGKWEAIGIIRDITQRKETESLLQQEKEFSDILVQTAPVIILILDRHGKVVRFNDYMETMSGYALNEVKGKDWFSTFLPEQDREKMKALFLNALKDVQTSGNINTLITKDGSHRLIQWYDKTLKDKDGHTIGLLSIGTDVTEREAVEEELKLFRTLLDYSNDAVEVIDAETLQYIDVNKTACRTLGYTRDELLSMNVREVDIEISDSKLQKLLQVLKDEKSAIFKSAHRRKDGSLFPVEIGISLAVQGDKEYTVAVVRDITERQQSDDMIHRTNRALKTLSAGNMALVQAHSEEELLKSVTEVIVKEGGYSFAVVDYAQDDTEKTITPMAWSGLEGQDCPCLKTIDTSLPRTCSDIKGEYRLIKGLSWSETSKNQMPVSKVIRTASPQITHDIAKESEFKAWRDAALDWGFNASIAFPLMKGEQVFGALHIYASDTNAFKDEEEVRLLEELTNDLAYGILSLRTRVSHEHQEMILRESLEQSIQTIAATVESRDPYTAGHQRRVSELATAIAQEMGLSEDQVNGIHLAAIIHDLGKIHIPAEILSKPGKLTNIEFMLIQTHPQSGYDILKNVKFPWPIADIIVQHHEKIDGSGYPYGLKDHQILLEAKIISVADVVEAISAHRPYRAALGIEVALDEIKKNSGITYDASVVDACVKLFEEKGFMFSGNSL